MEDSGFRAIYYIPYNQDIFRRSTLYCGFIIDFKIFDIQVKDNFKVQKEDIFIDYSDFVRNYMTSKKENENLSELESGIFNSDNWIEKDITPPGRIVHSFHNCQGITTHDDKFDNLKFITDNLSSIKENSSYNNNTKINTKDKDMNTENITVTISKKDLEGAVKVKKEKTPTIVCKVDGELMEFKNEKALKKLMWKDRPENVIRYDLVGEVVVPFELETTKVK